MKKLRMAWSFSRKWGFISSHNVRARVGWAACYSGTWQYKAIWLLQSVEFLRKCEWWRVRVWMYPSWSKTGPPRLLCGFHWAYYPRIKHEVPRMWFPTCGRVKEMAEALWNWSRVHRCFLWTQFAVLWESLLYFSLNPSLAMERGRMSPLGQRRGASEGHSDSGLCVRHTPSPGLTLWPGVVREKMSARPWEWIRLWSESDCSPWIGCGSHRESQLGHEDSLEWHEDASEAHASEARRQRGVSGWLEQRHCLSKAPGAWGTAGFSEEVAPVSHTNKSQPQISPKPKGHWHQFTSVRFLFKPYSGA